MKHTISCKRPIVIAFLSICFLLSIPFASTGIVETEASYSYTPGTKTGPEHWGELNPNWRQCSTGLAQSPIDISKERVEVQPYLGNLIRSYWPARATLRQRHHYIELIWNEQAGSIMINQTRYDLIQLHWHTPSEHTINGRRYELEMHMVHKSRNNATAVIAVLYKNGDRDKFLSMLEPYLRTIGTASKEEPIGMVNPRYAKGFSKKYYRYKGSLTTPPCTEGVVWTVLKKVRSVSVTQVQMLRQAVGEEPSDNARPLQKISGRVIGLYRRQKNHTQLIFHERK